jgi:diguanylate cyclase (GGDEF)-like protein
VEQTRDQAAFTVLLIRMDGYDEYRAAMGHQESDREMAALFERVQAGLPENALIGRFSADCLAVSLVGIGPVEAAQMARNWRDQVHQHRRRTCSIGVAVYPTGDLEPSEILVSAQKALEHAGFLGPSSVAVFDAVTLNISGDKKFEAGDFEGALDEYRRALVLSPNDLNVLNSLGVAYGYKKDLDRALETFDRVLALDPENFMAHYNQGFALAMAGRPEDALASFRTAARIAPDHFDILFSWGKMALELDLVDEADQAFERAIRAPGAGPIVYRFRGRTLLRLNRREEAIDAFKAAARHDPEDAESLSHLGTLYLERGTDLDVALSLIRQSVDLDPTNPLFRERLARAYAASGDPAGAERHWRRALDMGRRSREVYYELGRVVELLGRTDEARPLYEQALALDPEFKPAADALAALGGKKEGC